MITNNSSLDEYCDSDTIACQKYNAPIIYTDIFRAWVSKGIFHLKSVNYGQKYARIINSILKSETLRVLNSGLFESLEFYKEFEGF